MVHDRVSGEWFQVYSPRFVHQFHAEHRAGLWYVRPAANVESGPQSRGYATARASVEALRSGDWIQSTAIKAQSRKCVRVIWSTGAGKRLSPAQTPALAETC